MDYIVAYYLVVFVVLTCIATADGSDDYVTYMPGELPVILSAPHGGRLKPEHLPNRTVGCFREGVCDWRYNCGEQDFTRYQ